MRRLSTFAIVFVVVAAVFLPGGAAEARVLPHHVTLTGAQEVPPPGDGNGHGEFRWSVKGTRLCYHLSARKIGTAAAAHIHKAPRGVAGPVKVELKAPNKTSSDCVTIGAGFARALRNHPRRFYVNVHNVAHPAGAIRAQLRK